MAFGAARIRPGCTGSDKLTKGRESSLAIELGCEVSTRQ